MNFETLYDGPTNSEQSSLDKELAEWENFFWFGLPDFIPGFDEPFTISPPEDEVPEPPVLTNRVNATERANEGTVQHGVAGCTNIGIVQHRVAECANGGIVQHKVAGRANEGIVKHNVAGRANIGIAQLSVAECTNGGIVQHKVAGRANGGIVPNIVAGRANQGIVQHNVAGRANIRIAQHKVAKRANEGIEEFEVGSNIEVELGNQDSNKNDIIVIDDDDDEEEITLSCTGSRFLVPRQDMENSCARTRSVMFKRRKLLTAAERLKKNGLNLNGMGNVQRIAPPIDKAAPVKRRDLLQSCLVIQHEKKKLKIGLSGKDVSFMAPQ